MADFIITSLQSWDIEIGSTIKNTASEIAKKHRVLYVNPPMDIATRLRIAAGKGPLSPTGHRQLEVIQSKSAPLRQINENLWVLDCPFIGFPYWRKHGPRCEEMLVRQSDIVLANSSYFAEQLRPLNRHTYVLNTGVNLELYDATRHWDKPTDMQNIPSPIVGYTGAIIESRLDSELLYNIARQLPGYSFVFVGPEDKHFQKHLLHNLKNVFFTGRKEVEELPKYIQHFDICINPQILNSITDGNYPLKIDEYLAMGKPIVATSTHTMRSIFAGHTHLAVSTEEWIIALKAAANEAGNPKLENARIAFAHTHSWGHSVQTIYNAITRYVTKK